MTVPFLALPSSSIACSNLVLCKIHFLFTRCRYFGENKIECQNWAEPTKLAELPSFTFHFTLLRCVHLGCYWFQMHVRLIDWQSLSLFAVFAIVPASLFPANIYSANRSHTNLALLQSAPATHKWPHPVSLSCLSSHFVCLWSLCCLVVVVVVVAKLLKKVQSFLWTAKTLPGCRSESQPAVPLVIQAFSTYASETFIYLEQCISVVPTFTKQERSMGYGPALSSSLRTHTAAERESWKEKECLVVMFFSFFSRLPQCISDLGGRQCEAAFFVGHQLAPRLPPAIWQSTKLSLLA